MWKRKIGAMVGKQADDNELGRSDGKSADGQRPKGQVGIGFLQ